MFLLPEARGHGLAEPLIRQCLQSAKKFGFRTCSLETLKTVVAAQGLYEKLGFTRTVLQGAPGHSACDRFYSLALAVSRTVHRETGTRLCAAQTATTSFETELGA